MHLPFKKNTTVFITSNSKRHHLDAKFVLFPVEANKEVYIFCLLFSLFSMQAWNLNKKRESDILDDFEELLSFFLPICNSHVILTVYNILWSKFAVLKGWKGSSTITCNSMIIFTKISSILICEEKPFCVGQTKDD